MPSKKALLLGAFLIAACIINTHTTSINAACSEGRCDNPEEYDNYIKELGSKVLELSKAKDTLVNQINYLNTQVQLTLIKITQTENSISTLEKEVESLTQKIGNLDIYLNQLSSAYIEQINQNYRLQRRNSQLEFLINGNFNGLLERYKYISSVQKSSQETLINIETVRTNYDLQKIAKEKKQLELEVLRKSLASQKSNLASQKTTKTGLLEITKNDEAKYQSLKKAAENELSSLLKAKFTGKRQVKKGEALGVMGNTGYSFGDHLHFGLYDLREEDLSKWAYANDIDPTPYMNAHRKPMDDPIEITQGRGNTKYSYLYSDRFHHGIDMVSSNKTIRAVNDGIAYFFRNAGSSLGNHVKLFHEDGKMTLYLHMQ